MIDDYDSVLLITVMV